MEVYPNEFCDEEFYHILENMSPCLTNVTETTSVAWCQKCKCAPCACQNASFWMARNHNQQSKKRTNSSPNASEDYSISESKKSRSSSSTATRTVGVVEPRVVVKIPLNKIASTKKMSSSSITGPINEDSLCQTSISKGPLGPVEEGSLVPLSKENNDNMVCKMRTNGSQSGHIQVDKQTIETALDDEGGSRRRRQQQQQEVDLNEENDKKKATASSSVLLLRNGNGGNGLQQQQQSSPDLLDILDNFLITTSNPDETAASNAISQVSHAQMDNSTNISTRSSESVKFHFEEGGTSGVDEHRWMFCHVPGCSFWTSKSWRMERHKLCHSFETSPLDGGSNKRCYKCPDCHLKFFSLAKLLKHDRKKHTGVKDYECRICGAEVTDIQTHMRIHGDEKNHFCEHCPLSFRHKSSLVRHMFLHTGERPYRCQSCQSAFTARDRLKGHILKHHPNHPAAKEIKQNLNESSSKPIVQGGQQFILSEEMRKEQRNDPTNDVILHLEPTTTTLDLCWYTNAANEQEVQLAKQTANPLEVAIREIVEVEQASDPPVVQPKMIMDLSSQMTRLADKLKSLRETKKLKKVASSIPGEGKQVHICPKCGREYKYQSFLHVHLKRKCTS